MESILDALFKGKLCPAEQIPHDPAYEALTLKIGEVYELLESHLSLEDAALLASLKNAYLDLDDMTSLSSFKRGIRYGGLLERELHAEADE